jgi:TPR repeat protein
MDIGGFVNLDPGSRMTEVMRSYREVSELVDREVMTWQKLPPAQQEAMDYVFRGLQALAGGTAELVATEAQFVLGLLFQEGRGLPQPSPARAAVMYRAAAQGGCKEALYNLAGLTRTGAEGVARDENLAFAMYETAALQEHVNAAYNVAVMYSNGEGVDRDYYKADEWFSFAAARGHKQAQQNVEKLARRRNTILVLIVLTTIPVGLLVTWGIVNFFGNFIEEGTPGTPEVPSSPSFLEGSFGSADDGAFN